MQNPPEYAYLLMVKTNTDGGLHGCFHPGMKRFMVPFLYGPSRTCGEAYLSTRSRPVAFWTHHSTYTDLALFLGFKLSLSHPPGD